MQLLAVCMAPHTACSSKGPCLRRGRQLPCAQQTPAYGHDGTGGSRPMCQLYMPTWLAASRDPA